MKVWLLRLVFAKCGKDTSVLWSVSLCKIYIFFEKPCKEITEGDKDYF
jgi:hypothetical protein